MATDTELERPLFSDRASSSAASKTHGAPSPALRRSGGGVGVGGGHHPRASSHSVTEHEAPTSRPGGRSGGGGGEGGAVSSSNSSSSSSSAGRAHAPDERTTSPLQPQLLWRPPSAGALHPVAAAAVGVADGGGGGDGRPSAVVAFAGDGLPPRRDAGRPSGPSQTQPPQVRRAVSLLRPASAASSVASASAAGRRPPPPAPRSVSVARGMARPRAPSARAGVRGGSGSGSAKSGGRASSVLKARHGKGGGGGTAGCSGADEPDEEAVVELQLPARGLPEREQRLFDACRDGDVDAVYAQLWDRADVNARLPVFGTR
ncbi:hypothetical protein DFJ73DRAFT_892358 [Zopfochytrium polystomum]|nr:hypothetical protein DFJ73DRAFT_892358 [Zopfochytrium polystomum]